MTPIVVKQDYSILSIKYCSVTLVDAGYYKSLLHPAVITVWLTALTKPFFIAMHIHTYVDRNYCRHS